MLDYANYGSRARYWPILEDVSQGLPHTLTAYSRSWELPWVYTEAGLNGAPCEVLEAGCGNSVFPSFLRRKGHHVSVVDLVGDGTDGIDAFLGREENQGIPYRIEDIRAMGWPDETFDRVVCMSVIEHIADPAGPVDAVKELTRVLKTGGFLAVTTDLNLSRFASDLNRLVKRPLALENLRLLRPGAIFDREILADPDIIFSRRGEILDHRRFWQIKDIYVTVGFTIVKVG